MTFCNNYECDKCIKQSVCKYVEEVENISKSLDEKYSQVNNPVLRLTLSCKEEREK